VLIDTHCHLSDPAFDADREAVLDRMRAAGVDRALVVESVRAAVSATYAFVTAHPPLGMATACHPHDASGWSNEWSAELREWWRRPGVRAAGEIGLDYHYDHSPRSRQQEAFAAQLSLAAGLGLPVVIHAREADDDVVAILRQEPRATVVLHSFSSGPVLRRAGLDAGWYFSFSGMVTFKSWQQTETVALVPPERLLVETDAPYLAPVPHRGRRNEPAFVADVARRVAELRNAPVDAIATLTTGNARRLFWRDAPAVDAGSPRPIEVA
jgi:TatD DNase family protein